MVSRAVLHVSRRSPVPDAVQPAPARFICHGERNMKLIFQHGDGRLLTAGGVAPCPAGAQVAFSCFARNRPVTAGDNNTTSTISFDMVPAPQDADDRPYASAGKQRRHKINQRGKNPPGGNQRINAAITAGRLLPVLARHRLQNSDIDNLHGQHSAAAPSVAFQYLTQ